MNIFAKTLKNMYRFLLLIFAAITAVFPLSAQSSSCPVIGAQIFIEPGQTPQEIDGFFSTMEECGMKVGRIRMFGTHMLREDGSWDFSLYDTAFESAAKHGVKLFATLFPSTDELSDVGGFKFPYSQEHLSEVDDYVRNVVGHFRGKEALDCWVLQNEPGKGSIMNHDATPLSRKVYRSFKENSGSRDSTGYLFQPFENERFQRYYTDWYLRHISDIVQDIDPFHGRHINPHQILRTLPEYDFQSFGKYLTSLGSSMHASWHFGDFRRSEYPLGVALMSDIIADASGDNPWWITEMQGGPVTASGDRILCPTAQETREAVWTGIFSGARGVMFWTLNPRRAVREAGEWAMTDFAGGKSDRLEGITVLNALIDSERDFYETAFPVKSSVYILYAKEAFWAQYDNVKAGKTAELGRSDAALPAAMISAYKAISESGLSPVIQDIETFDFDPSKTVVLPNVIAIPDSSVMRLCEFVANGGTLISTGMTWYYDAGMRCRFMSDSPIYDCLGGRLKEFNVGDRMDIVKCLGLKLPVEYWTGIVIPDGADEVISDAEGRPVALKNRYGKGVSWWFPSMIDIGSRTEGQGSDIAAFYRIACANAVESDRYKFARTYKDVFCRVLKNGKTVMMLLVNEAVGTQTIKMDGTAGKFAYVDGTGKICRHRVVLPSGGYLVLKGEEK